MEVLRSAARLLAPVAITIWGYAHDVPSPTLGKFRAINLADDLMKKHGLEGVDKAEQALTDYAFDGGPYAGLAWYRYRFLRERTRMGFTTNEGFGEYLQREESAANPQDNK